MEVPGWVSTDLRADAAAPLDVRRSGDWARSFAPSSIDRIVAEHVIEHMSHSDARAALCNIKRFLKPGGHVRIAVPDAFNPNPAYQEHSRPGGKGQAWARLLFYADDEPPHVEHYDYQSLSALLEEVGLEPRLLEWHDEAGVFRRNQWSLEDGPVRRYYDSPYNRNVYLPFHGFQNLSLIVDGVKSVDARDVATASDYCEVTLNRRAAVRGGAEAVDTTGRLIFLGALAAWGFAAYKRRGWL